MKVVRSPRPERGYTVYDNRMLRDRRLSWIALGILVEILSNRDGWETDSLKLAASRPGVGRDLVRRALRELEALGYLEREKARERNADGKFVWKTYMTVRDVPKGGFPPSDSEGDVAVSVDTASDAGHPVPGNVVPEPPTPTCPPSDRPAVITGGHETCAVSDDDTVGVGRPAVGNPAPTKKDQQEDHEGSKAAASGDHDQSRGEDEPSPDALKILDGCGTSPSSKAWVTAATEALARGGTPLDVIDHVMAPVTGEPRSVEAIRLTRLRTWPGKQSPRSPDELYAEIRAEIPPPAPEHPSKPDPGPPPRRTPDNPPDGHTAPPAPPPRPSPAPPRPAPAHSDPTGPPACADCGKTLPTSQTGSRRAQHCLICRRKHRA